MCRTRKPAPCVRPSPSSGRARAAAEGRGHVLVVTLDAVRQLLALRAGSPASRVVERIDRAERELRHSMLRLKDLLIRARDESETRDLLRIADRKGLQQISFEPQLHGGTNLVGWRVRLKRAP